MARRRSLSSQLYRRKALGQPVSARVGESPARSAQRPQFGQRTLARAGGILGETVAMTSVLTYATISGSQVALIVVAGVIVWVLLAGVVAEYGRGKGYPWFPLFVSGVFLSWALVLLAVTVAHGQLDRPEEGK